MLETDDQVKERLAKEAAEQEEEKGDVDEEGDDEEDDKENQAQGNMECDVDSSAGGITVLKPLQERQSSHNILKSKMTKHQLSDLNVTFPDVKVRLVMSGGPDSTIEAVDVKYGDVDVKLGAIKLILGETKLAGDSMLGNVDIKLGKLDVLQDEPAAPAKTAFHFVKSKVTDTVLSPSKQPKKGSPLKTVASKKTGTAVVIVDGVEVISAQARANDRKDDDVMETDKKPGTNTLGSW